MFQQFGVATCYSDDVLLVLVRQKVRQKEMLSVPVDSGKATVLHRSPDHKDPSYCTNELQSIREFYIEEYLPYILKQSKCKTINKF